jgi:long-subunit acyl-CoA synthetase (AMP-forming)
MYNLQTGKKVYPEITEQLLTADRLIEHALLYGDDSRPYNVALISLDSVQVAHLNESSREPAQLNVMVSRIIDKINQKLPPEQKAGCWLVVEMSQANELVTATRKVRYSRVIERYWREIEELYKNHGKGS